MNRGRFVLTLLTAAGAIALAVALQTPLEAVPPGAALQAVQGAGTQAEANAGAAAYAKNCSMCHGDHRQGNPPAIPTLIGVGQKMTADQIAHLIHTGRGPMPAFGSLPDSEVKAIVTWLTGPGSGPAQPSTASQSASLSGPAQAGDSLFRQNCSFCHGRDAMGGESGPDLTRSKLVLSDKAGDRIIPVVREGRPGTRMPAFNLSSQEMQDLVAFIHARVTLAASQQGKRRGVDVSDLQTGNVEAGKAFFNGPGGCAKCHSPSGDLAGVATRYQGLQLEERMLYPRDAKSTVTVTLPAGEKISGTLAYRDEFTIGLRDSSGQYRSWKTDRVQFTVDSPADAHVRLFPQYTDADVHNLMAYIQTLR